MTTPLHGRRKRRYTATEIRTLVGKRFETKPHARLDEKLPQLIADGSVWHGRDEWRSRYAAAMIAAGRVDAPF